MRYAALREPISQLQQIVSESREALLLFTALPPGLRPQHTGGNTLLMYVQTAIARIDNFHRATPFHRAALDASKKAKISYACSPQLLESTRRRFSLFSKRPTPRGGKESRDGSCLSVLLRFGRT